MKAKRLRLALKLYGFFAVIKEKVVQNNLNKKGGTAEKILFVP